MGTYNIPRNVKGEGRILFIFSTKALIYTVVGLVLGLPFYFIFNSIGIAIIGIILMILMGIIGFVIGTFKIPEFKGIKITRMISGESIDDVIKKSFLFKRKGKKIYIYTKEEEKNG